MGNSGGTVEKIGIDICMEEMKLLWASSGIRKWASEMGVN